MVESINLIPPRGCAFVHMNRRMDAYKALKELHKHKLHGKPITVSPEKFRIYSPPPIYFSVTSLIFWKVPEFRGKFEAFRIE